MYVLLMLSWLPHTALVLGVLPAPERLSLKSEDFNHVLQWERGAGTSPEVTYSVSYHKERGPWMLVAGCERVLEPLLCDLTVACSDPYEIYGLMVTALHHAEQSSSSLDQFHPISYTKLQPPVLRVAPCNSSLCVDVDTPVPHLHSYYESFCYELKVDSRTAQQAMLMPFRSLGRKILDVRVGSEYCVSIRFADSIMPRQSSFGPAQCVPVHSPTTPTATVLPLVLLPGLLVLLLLAAIYTYSIFLKKPALPSVLTSVPHSEEKLKVSCHPAVSSLLFIEPAPPEGQTDYCSLETDNSEDEQDLVDARGTTDAVQYRSKASLYSVRDSGSNVPHNTAKAVEVQMEGPEEVDLLTVIFSRDKESDTIAALLPEVELLVCDVMEEQHEPKEDFGEECFETGYMSR